jgi:hypothetical protein
MAERRPHLDNLKIILVAGVIFGHAWAGYAELGAWTYDDVREGTLAPATQTVLEAVIGPFALIAMGFFFLLSGLLTPGSLARKGSSHFARDRLVRLGLPLLVFTIVLWPPAIYAMHRLAGRPVGHLDFPDTAHLWFLEVLLLFSLSYAALHHRLAARPAGDLRAWHLAVLAAAIAAGSFLVRVWFPLDTTGILDLHLSQWPQYLALFGLGVASARAGWLDPVPDRLRRGCGIAALAGVAAIAGFAGVVALAGVPATDFLGGWHWASAGTSVAEGLLAVTVSVWLLGFTQRHLDHPHPAARYAYAAFLVQGHVLIALALSMRALPVAVEIKAVVVSVLGVLGSYALSWLLVRRTPLGRLL